MIYNYVFGEPVDTGAVVLDIPSKKDFAIGKINSVWPFIWDYQLNSEDKVFGLGESMRGINKRGFKYTSWCSDECHQDESKASLYGAHNFIIIFGQQTVGLFFDTASRIDFDIGFTKSNVLTVTTSDTGLRLFQITPENDDKNALLSIVHQFRKLIGQSYIPPFWAFGFQQSRWGYRNEKDILEVVKKYKELNIPLDSICMDIDYMEEYEDFTIDKSKFPDLTRLSSELKNDGIRLIPIIDAGVKIKDGYSIYEEGMKNNFFCKKADGKYKGKLYRHDKVHNMYGGLMTRAAAEGLNLIEPDKRMLLYSRASIIGAHRYGGIWTGDVNSWWAHLEQHIKVLPALNMCGFLYVGSDIGGFCYDTSRDLVMRWTALSLFTPLMRNHSSDGTRRQECYQFENPEEFKTLFDLRYALIPYLYSEYIKCALENKMMFKPLCFEYPEDKLALETEDQLFLGNEIMIAPVYKQNATGRYVYLPENMTKITWKDSKATQESMEKGIHFIEVPLNTVVFFIRENKTVPLCKPAKATKFLNQNCFELLGTGTEYELYQDDGFAKNIDLQKGIKILKK